jgi:hypothetical protein
MGIGRHAAYLALMLRERRRVTGISARYAA